ncbi:MAG: hypothetical protein AAAB35_23780 [Phyllobacterium sp.]|uniref:hypothetical protein n=1 Tax=Phyllobacterium sp. TaxID=1871046 RepID=UPI0030F06F7F
MKNFLAIAAPQTTLEGQMPYGHELHKLYKRLPIPIKAELNVLWAKGFAQSPYLKRQDFLDKLPERVDLYAVPRQANFMQRQSRYSFENKPNENVFIIQDLPELLYDYLTRLKPAWKFPVIAA